jgi:adenylate kinase family enzyme
MQRVVILGSGGAGKSTLARRIGDRLALPVIHLDREHWLPGWVETPSDEWADRVAMLVAGDRWVIDGNYGGTIGPRLRACDTAIFLDLPRRVCLWRVIRRWRQYRGRTRPDMTPGCNERLDWVFVRWIWNYPRLHRPAVLKQLATLGAGQRVVHLRSRRAVEEFVATL